MQETLGSWRPKQAWPKCSRFQELVDLRDALHHQVFPSTFITTTSSIFSFCEPINHGRKPLQNNIIAWNSEDSMFLPRKSQHSFLTPVGPIPSRKRLEKTRFTDTL